MAQFAAGAQLSGTAVRHRSMSTGTLHALAGVYQGRGLLRHPLSLHISGGYHEQGANEPQV